MPGAPMHPRRRLARIIRESSQMIRDVELWNRHRTDAEPLDCEESRVMLRLAMQAAVAWDAKDFGAAGKAMSAMVDYANGVLKEKEVGFT